MHTPPGIAFISIILFNLLPIIGVAFYNWSPFEMFWLFWMETLIISVFNTIRILFGQGKLPGDASVATPIKLNLSPALRYLVVRILVFLFYSLFIIVFIGFLAGSEQDPVHVVRTLGFGNLLFNLALLISICTQSFYLVKYFFLNGAFLNARHTGYPGVFDGRQIVMHIAVVVGAVGAIFLFKDASNPRFASIWIISILCIAKCLFELLVMKRDTAPGAKRVGPEVQTQASNITL